MEWASEYIGKSGCDIGQSSTFDGKENVRCVRGDRIMNIKDIKKEKASLPNGENMTFLQKEHPDVDINYRSTRNGVRGLPESVRTDLDLICGNSKAGRTVLQSSDVSDVDVDSKPDVRIKPESDVDLLYSYYTCVSPERRDEPFFQKIKSEPWIEVPQLQETMPTDLPKLQGAIKKGHSPQKSDRELMVQDYYDTALDQERDSKEDVLSTSAVQSGQPGSTTSLTTIAAQPDNNLIERNPRLLNPCLLKLITSTNSETEFRTAVWQPVVRLERLSRIPSEAVRKDPNEKSMGNCSNSGAELITSEPKGHKSSRPPTGTSETSPDVSFDTSRESSPESVRDPAEERRIEERIKFILNQVKLFGELPTPEAMLDIPEVPLSNIRPSTSLEDTGSKAETQRTDLQKYAQPKVNSNDKALGNLEGDGVAASSQRASRPARRSAVKAIEKIHAGRIESDEPESDLHKERVNTIEDSDYEESDGTSSEDDATNEMPRNKPAADRVCPLRSSSLPVNTYLPAKKQKAVDSSQQDCETNKEPLRSSLPVKTYLPAKKQKVVESSQEDGETNKEPLERPFQCSVCESRFFNKGTLRRHRLSFHRDLLDDVQIRKCEICALEFLQDDELKQHELHIHNKVFEVKKYPCGICDREFIMKGTMLRHKAIMHCKDRKCVCEQCGQVLASKTKLIFHLADHKKPFKCDICNTSWSRLYNLQMHMRTHTGEKPFKCEVCQQGFSRLHNMKVHIKLTHKDVLRYECIKCQEKFKTLKERIDHTRKKHPKVKKRTPCKICGEMLLKKSLEPHARLHTEDKIMKCERCEKYVKLTHDRFKYRLKDKNGKPLTACHACFEEHAKTFKPEEYKYVRKLCRYLDKCQYCLLLFDVRDPRTLKQHEINCPFKDIAPERSTINQSE